MSGVNSKCSRGDLIPPSRKRLKQEDLTSALVQVEIGLGEQEKQPESTVDPVRRIPDELLADVFASLAADSDLEELLNVRLVSSLCKREASVALKTNVAMLPWIVQNDDLMQDLVIANVPALKSLGSWIRNIKPGSGLPFKLVINEWTPELETFLRDYSSDIVSLWIGGDKFDGFPVDLGGIELPSLEHAPFSVFGIRNVEGECDGFTKALAFWKELVKVSKNLKTCPIDIYLEPWWNIENQLTPAHKVFDLLDWSQVNSLCCNTEFFLDVSATHELPTLRTLQCRANPMIGIPLEYQVSLEKAPNLEEVTFHYRKIVWILHHPLKNLRVLTLNDNTINCVDSPSKMLPNLKKITIFEEENDGDLGVNGPFSCLVSGGGVFEKAVELYLREYWENVNERISDLAVQLCDSFPWLTHLEWISEKGRRAGRVLNLYNKNALKAAPAIFSKLEHLTRLGLQVSLASAREVVELITGISLEEIPEEEESWPSALAGNPRSITNLKNLQSFGLRLIASIRWGRKPTVCVRDTRFLFTAAFRTMSTLTELSFFDIKFENTSCVAAWTQMGRKIEILHDYEEDSLWGSESDTSDSDSESSGDGDEKRVFLIRQCKNLNVPLMYPSCYSTK